MTNDKTALVLGVTGTFGSHMTAALLSSGWRVAAMTRDPAAARAKAGPNMPIDWRAGDAMNPADVSAAATGARLIVHAVNPPRYRNWGGVVLPMLESTLAAAKAHGARILLPGTVYNYAPDAGEQIVEDAAQAPVTRKGAIRAKLEARLQSAAREEGVSSLIIRAGDFFGPAAPNSVLAFYVARQAGRPLALLEPGPRDVPHAFAYLPDLTKAATRLVEREDELETFSRFHFAGHTLTLRDLQAALRRASGGAWLPALPFPWTVPRAMAPFDETMRELLEMRYLWRRPITLCGDRLETFLGEVRHTPIEAALAAFLADGEPLPASTAAPRIGGLLHA